MNILAALLAVTYTNFFYCTQYYRAPTPLPAEWDGDMAALACANVPALVLRVHWRNNERREGVYDFSDIDALFDLAERHGRQVAIEVMLECAPQYVFDKYGGDRVDHRGGRGLAGVNGAFYTGGWLPCFQNPKVAERGAAFAEALARRYANRRSLVLWNAWNEPRSRPADECFCRHCRRAYGDYLKAKFGTIERLNAFYGVCEESFDNIAMPTGGSGHWDLFEFKHFKGGKCIRDNLRLVYDAIRRYDKVRPIVSHAGATCGFQMQIHDVVNDFEAKAAVDGWGTSLPLATRMFTPERRLEYNRLMDFLRAVDPDFLVFEIYPGLGSFKHEYDDRWDLAYKIYTGAAAGAKGLNFWQYRAERLGSEDDCAGLVRMNGKPRPCFDAVRKFGAELKQFGGELVGFYPKKGEVAVVFDYDSLLMSEVVDAEGTYDFAKIGKSSAIYYPNAHKGWYQLLRWNDVAVDYLPIQDLETKLAGYKIAVFPPCEMFDPKYVPAIEKFVRDGGTIVADEGFGLRARNTWMNTGLVPAGGIMKAELEERRRGPTVMQVGDAGRPSGRKIAVDGALIETFGYDSEYAVDGADTVLTFEDGRPAAQSVRHGDGRMVLLGFSLGYSHACDGTAPWYGVFRRITAETSLSRPMYGSFEGGLEERRLRNGDDQYLFLVNTSDEEKSVALVEHVEKSCADGRIENGRAFIPPKSAMILKCRGSTP